VSRKARWRQAVERGTLREDLFYRLQVFDIQLPALHDRISDVPLLAEHFLGEFGKALGHRSTRLADEARDALLAHMWPGNIRELRNVLESAAILSDNGVVERRHLSLQATPDTTASSVDSEAGGQRAPGPPLATSWQRARARSGAAGRTAACA